MSFVHLHLYGFNTPSVAKTDLLRRTSVPKPSHLTGYLVGAALTLTIP